MSGRWRSCSARCCGCVSGRGWSSLGWCRSTGPGLMATAAPMRIVGLSRSRVRFWPRPRRPMRPRMSFMARSMAMNCPSSCARRRVAASSFAGPGNSCGAGTSAPSWARIPKQRSRRRCRLSSIQRGSWRGCRDGKAGCGKASASSSATAGNTRIGSRAPGLIGCCWRPSGWSQSMRSSVVPTRPMSSIECGAERRTGGGSQARRSRMCHRRCRRGG